MEDMKIEYCNICGSEISTDRQYGGFICLDCCEKADYDPIEMEKVNMIELARKIIKEDENYKD